MGAGVAIVAGILAAGSAVNSYEQGKSAKKAAEHQQELQREANRKQEIANKKAEQRSLLTSTQKVASDIKAKTVAEKDQARSTSKVRERQRRQGKGSLLTGGEAGNTNTIASTGLGNSSIQL